MPPPPLACSFKGGDQAERTASNHRVFDSSHSLRVLFAFSLSAFFDAVCVDRVAREIMYHVMMLQVQYYRETKHKWMETTVIRIFELAGSTAISVAEVKMHRMQNPVPQRKQRKRHDSTRAQPMSSMTKDGNICYDLECKKNVFADKAGSRTCSIWGNEDR